jgi:ADP-heptose:LPS heptosyltransferase
MKLHKKILIIKVDHIGDYILFRNLLKPLRKKYPNSKITLIGNNSYKNIFENYDSNEVDKFIGINQKMFYNNKKYRDKVLNELSKSKYDIIIHPTFSRIYVVDEFISKINAIQKISPKGDSFNQSAKSKKISDKFYTALIKNPEMRLNKFGTSTKIRTHEFDKQKAFFSKLLNQDLTKIPISLKYKKNKQNNYAIIFPGADSKLRMWSPKKFTKIANFLSVKYKLKILVCGNGKDITSAKKIIKNSKINIKNMVNKTSLSELINLIGNAKIIITGNTCAAHIAAATKTKFVCIDTGIFHGRFLPYPNMNSTSKLCLPPLYFKNFHGPINLVSSKQVKNKIIELIK